jgi:hypothetical protein
MRSVWRFSALVFFAALLCFLPCAFGQGTANIQSTGPGNRVLNYVPSSFLAFAPGSGGLGDWHRRDPPPPPPPICKSDKGCAAVPEGGTAVMYLLLAGLSCLGAMALRSRRQACVRETN